jgi:hypothetical protein
VNNIPGKDTGDAFGFYISRIKRQPTAPHGKTLPYIDRGHSAVSFEGRGATWSRSRLPNFVNTAKTVANKSYDNYSFTFKIY